MKINPLISTPSHTTISSSGNQLTRFARNTANNLAKVAIPLIVTAALASIPSADAGPLAYAACIAACISSGPLAIACWLGCTPILTAPTP
jgi:hypothetical protein